MQEHLEDEPGIKQAEKVFGAHIASSLAHFWEDVDPEFSHNLCNYAYGVMYSRTILPQRERELCACMALTVLDKQPQLRAHIQAALHCGATRAEVTEVVLQAHLYGGVPVTMNGLTTLRSVFAEMDAGDSPVI